MFNKWFFPHNNKANHFKPLDGLRGLAVLIVMLSHSSNTGLLFHEHLNLHGTGKAGVYLFFILSAYLLDRQIAQAFLNKKVSLRYWLNYFWRRFIRIYPLFLVALVSYYILNSIGYFPTKIEAFSDIPQHLFLIEGKTIFWSIPVEFKYYFISPVIMWCCHKYLKWSYLKIFLFVLMLVLTTLLLASKGKLSNISTLKYAPIFLSGTFLSVYELLNHVSFKKLNNRLFDILGITSLILIFMSFPYYSTLLGFELKFHKPPFYLLYMLLWSILLLSSKRSDGFIKSILCFKPLRFLGTISYSLYLFHMLVIPFVKRINIIPSDFQIYLFFLVSIIFSSISYLLIELPLSKISFPGKKILDVRKFS